MKRIPSKQGNMGIQLLKNKSRKQSSMHVYRERFTPHWIIWKKNDKMVIFSKLLLAFTICWFFVTVISKLFINHTHKCATTAKQSLCKTHKIVYLQPWTHHQWLKKNIIYFMPISFYFICVFSSIPTRFPTLILLCLKIGLIFCYKSFFVFVCTWLGVKSVNLFTKFMNICSGTFILLL